MPLTVIRASAGSGKTYRLAVAFLRLLLRAELAGQPLDPSKILATTFTRAAAGEILDRVLQLLANAVLSEPECSGLAASTGLALTPAHCGRVLGQIALRLDQLTISTMDSFFGQIAKAFSAELGMAPGWQMAVNEAETEVQRATVHSLLEGTDEAALVEALTTYRKQQVGSSVQGALDQLSGAFQKLPGDPTAHAPFRLAPPRNWDAGETAEALALLACREEWSPKTKTGKIPARWQKAFEELTALLQPGQKADRLFGVTLVARVYEEADFDGKPIPDGFSQTLAPLIAIARDEIRRQYRARMEAFEWLAQCYQQARLATLFDQASYTFGDVTRSVGRQAICGDDLYFRLGTQFEHVLFDEFQDTSRQQFEFFRPLLEEIGASGDSSIFVVGDEKQAIYGWRGGDREVMHGPLQALGRQIGEQPTAPLSQSYRSSPAVLQAVNRTFHALEGSWCADKPVLEAAGRVWTSGFTDHTPAPRVAHLQGEVRLLEVETGDDDDKNAPLVARAVELVREHLLQDPQRKIALLLRKKNLMSRLLAEIRRACPETEVSGEGGNPLTDSRAVELILSLLTYLDHPGHTAARYHVLSSPLRAVFGFPETVAANARPDPDEWGVLNTLRRDLMHRGLAELVRTWIRSAAFIAACNEYDRVRCEQLLELAREWDQRPPARLSQFVEHVRNRRMERQGGANVRILSIHASKGLEFETVILLELDARQGNNTEPSVMEYEGALQLVPSKDESGLLGLKALYEEKVSEEFMGELSVLYVGMTRARCFLDIVLHRDSKTPIAQLLRTGLNPEGSPIVESFEGQTARECDAANGRGSVPQPEDPGIARESVPAARPTSHLRATYATPSSQEAGGVLSAASILAPANRGAMKRGELVHAWLAQISWIEDGLPTVAELLAATKTFGEEAEEEAGRLLEQIRKPESPLHRIFSQPAQPCAELWRERRFAVMDATAKGAELLTGTFDRVVLWRNADGTATAAEIIDFKTDPFSGETDRQRLEERYRPQLAAYRRALCLLVPGLKEVEVSLGLLGAGRK